MTLFTAFLPAAPLASASRGRRAAICRAPQRMTATPPPSDDDKSAPPPPPKLPVTNSPPSTRKLTRNKAGTTGSANNNPPIQSGASTFADARPGDMVGGPKVGEGMGPRRGAAEKKVTRAAAIQKSRSFADAWAEQNEGKVDVWLIIGALTLLTPIVILIWGIASGAIPTGGLFDE